MRIKPADLERTLRQSLQRAYWLTGDDPFLMEESKIQIKQAAKLAGFAERITFSTAGAELITSLRSHCANPSLFSTPEQIELNFSTSKLTKVMLDDLNTALTQLTNDQVLIITSPKLDPTLQKAAGFKTIEAQLVLIQIWPIAYAQLPQYLQQQANAVGLQIDRALLPWLASYFENNLLAAKQFFWRLSLQYQGSVTHEQLTAELVDLARFDIFDLSQQCLQGKATQVERTLLRLQEQNSDPILILWVLARDVRLCLQLNTAHYQQPATRNQLFLNNKIWETARPLYLQAYQRQSLATWISLTQIAFNIDLAIKGLRHDDLWRELMRLGLAIAGTLAISSVASQS